MNEIDDLVNERGRFEFTSTPTDLVRDAIREYNNSQPRYIRECDNHAVQQSALWAYFGNQSRTTF